MRSFPIERVSLGLVVCVAMAGCAGNERPVDQPQTFTGQEAYPPQQEPLPPQQGLPRAQPLVPAPSTSATATTPAPTATAGAGAGTGAAPPPSPLPGSPVDPGLLGPIGAGTMAILTPGGLANDPIEAGIKAAATRFAPNMQPEGQMAKDTLQENGHKAMVVTLTGGKCYSIVGFSPSGQIRNLDLRLLAPPFYNVQVGQDDTADGTPVLGKGANPTCPITPFPLQYKLDIHAQKGSGPFGVQVFSRPK